MLPELQKSKEEYYSERETYIRRCQSANFGERYAGATLAQLYSGAKTQEKIGKFLNKKKNFLIYLGSPGCGKTYTCAALTEYAIENFRSFRYWNESELLKRVRSSMSAFSGGDYLTCLKYLIDDDLVIIDDIGSTGLNDWRKEVIFDAIDERYNSMKPTIITSNFSRDEIERNFHPRVASRLFSKENIVIELSEIIDYRK